MKKILLICILLSLLLLLVGCGYGELSGTVISKDYTPAFTTTTMIYAGKTMVPQMIYYPENWSIQIEKMEDRKIKDDMG